MKKLEKLKDIFNNLKNYYNNNKQNILIIFGFLVLVCTISVLITLMPITNCAGLPLEITLELYIIIFILVAALLSFFILSIIVLILIKNKIQQNKETNKFIRDVSWSNIIFINLVFIFFALFPLYRLYSGNVLICGVVPEITMPLYLFVLSTYTIFYIILLMFITFIETLIVRIYEYIKKKIDKND